MEAVEEEASETANPLMVQEAVDQNMVLQQEVGDLTEIREDQEMLVLFMELEVEAEAETQLGSLLMEQPEVVEQIIHQLFQEQLV